MAFFGIWIGAVLTLLVLSYLIADTLLFRLAQALFVGVAIGYGMTLVIHRVLLQGVIEPLLTGGPEALVLLAPLVLGFLLLFKSRSGGELWSVLGNVPLGYLFGVGAALALGGALVGTLAPQFAATTALSFKSGNPLDLVNNVLILFGTLGTLLAFRFTTGFPGPLRVWSAVGHFWGGLGRLFLMAALGALLAGALTARVSILVSQVYFLLHDWLGIVH